ncbi:MAG: NUDIX domain-containing protein [Anaerolineae bacterium]|nr:NUDIX domain-containing protein [Anaerolineae bacterium]
MPSEGGLKECAVLCILRAQDPAASSPETGERMLLLRRGKPGPLYGMHVPIGGHIESHESPRQAAIREAHEEAGVTLDRVTFCGVLVETSPVAYNWITFIYSANVEEMFDPPQCREGMLTWVTEEALATLATPDTDAHIYQYVAQGQRFVLDAVYDAELRLLSLVEELSGEVLVAGERGLTPQGKETDA